MRPSTFLLYYTSTVQVPLISNALTDVRGLAMMTGQKHCRGSDLTAYVHVESPSLGFIPSAAYPTIQKGGSSISYNTKSG